MRDILRRNLGYKLVSLALAIIFWIWITSLTEPATLWGKQTLDVPLVINNQPSNLLVISNIPTISVRVDNTNDQGIDVKSLFAYVDLTDAVAGEHSYEVFMDVPEGLNIENISPSNVVLKLDTVKDKIVPVRVDIKGTPPSGFIVGTPVITPPVVNVRGPTSILQNMEEVSIEVDVTGSRETMRVARPVTFKDVNGRGLFAANPNLESLQSFPNNVEVIVPIYAKGVSSKMVPIKVNTQGNPATGLAVRLVTPLPSQVQLMGEEEALRSVQQLNLDAVDVSGLSSNKVIEIPLNSITLPKGVSFSEGTSISVMVHIGPTSENRIIKDIPVGIRNIPQDMNAEPIPSIEIVVHGYPDILDAIQARDISAWVDATGLEAGEYPETTVLWNLPAGATMVNIPKVTLVLTSTVEETEDNVNTVNTGNTVQDTDYESVETGKIE